MSKPEKSGSFRVWVYLPLRQVACFGLVPFLAFAFGAPTAAPFDWIRLLWVFAGLVAVPWALSLEGDDRPGAGPFAAAFVAALTLYSPKTGWSAAGALPWLAFTLTVAWQGWRKRRGDLVGRCVLLGHLYLPVGGVWLFLSCLGWNPFGFSEPVVLLTAIHFHYAAFLAPFLVGKAAEALPPGFSRRLLSGAAVGLVTAVPCLALGITYSRPLEIGAALGLASALTLYALVLLANLGRVERLARFFLALSTLSVLATMAFAALYATRELGGWPQWDIARLARWHGSLNAFGFVWCGLLGWALEEGRAPRDWTQAPVTAPPGTRCLFHDEYEIELAERADAKLFDRAVKELGRCEFFPPRLLTYEFLGSPLKVGSTLVQRVSAGPLKLQTAVRVMAAGESRELGLRRFAITVATLSGHIEKGFESFVVQQDPAGRLSFRIEAFSQPHHALAWMAFPLTRFLQRTYSRAALAHFRECFLNRR